MKGRLYGVGVGPGDPELMTLKAVRALKESAVVGVPGKDPSKSVAYQIALGAYPELPEKETLLLPTPMNKKYDSLDENYRECALKIEAMLDEGKDVALITLGDPTVYATYGYIHKNVVKDGYAAEIISGIPSFCATAATLGVMLGEREDQIHVIPASYDIMEALELPGTKVLMKAASKMGEVKKALMEKNADVQMIENCGMPTEKIYRSAEEMPEEASYYSLVIVKDKQ